MNRPPLKVGDHLFCVQQDQRRVIGPCEVTAIGRKYFTVDASYRSKFRNTDWGEEGAWQPTFKLYASEAEYKEALERLDLLRSIRNTFNAMGSAHEKLTMQDLRSIQAIIN